MLKVKDWLKSKIISNRRPQFEIIAYNKNGIDSVERIKDNQAFHSNHPYNLMDFGMYYKIMCFDSDLVHIHISAFTYPNGVEHCYGAYIKIDTLEDWILQLIKK